MKDNLYLFISSISAYVIIALITIFVSENITDNVYDRRTLYDVIHHYVPQYPDPAIPDAITLFTFFYMIVRWWNVDLKIPTVYFYSLAALMFVRLFTFTTTQTPPPRKRDDKWRIDHCKRTVLKHFGVSFLKTSETCIDNMFSGHAATLMCALCVILLFSKNMTEKIVASIIISLATFAIITSRMHYTSDVIVAVVVSIMAVLITKHIFFDKK